MRSCIAVVLVLVGCSVLSTEDRKAWELGKQLQAEERHQEAIVQLSGVLNRYEDEDEPELLPLRLDLARSLFTLRRFSETEDIVEPLRRHEELTEEAGNDILRMSGWIALFRAREGAAAAGHRQALLTAARRAFYRLLARSPGTYEGKLGRGLALYDTSKLLGRPPSVAITDKSGVDGVALWVNSFLGLEGDGKASKSAVARIARWVRNQYDVEGRNTAISNEEMEEQARRHLPEHFTEK